MNRDRTNRHTDRASELVAHEAALFIKLEAGKDSLITVTRALPSNPGDRITVFVSVFPEDKERPALAFLERQRKAFSEYLKSRVRLAPLPRVDFVLDTGEKNRRRLDEISGGPGGN